MAIVPHVHVHTTLIGKLRKNSHKQLDVKNINPVLPDQATFIDESSSQTMAVCSLLIV